MPQLSELMNSRFLKKESFTPKGFSVTINTLERMNVAPDDSPKEMKWVIFFDEFEKGMVLNPTNATTLSEIFGSENTDDWIGQSVTAYVDPSIMMGTKRVGGIRFRGKESPRTEEAPRRPAPARARQEEYDDQEPPRRAAPQRPRAAQTDPDDDVPY